MRLPIEVWIDERNYSRNVRELFSEAVICYRNRAYRASLLLSYLGFLTIIKDNLIRSKKPAEFSDTEWAAKVREINVHDGWEAVVHDALLQGSSGGRAKLIFRLNPDIIQQLQYWRSRRNDAAHYKDNEIGGHHTDAIWSFIKSNVPKMVVNGGMEGLLNKMVDHFDDLKTAPGLDVTPLINEIPESVLSVDMKEFIEQLHRRLRGILWFDDLIIHSIFDKILDVADSRVHSALTSYLKEQNLDLKFINYFPHRLILMEYEAHEIRQLWKLRIFDVTIHINPFNIYCEILRQNLISANELQGAHQIMFNKFDQRAYHKLPEGETDQKILRKSGFYDVVYTEAIINQELKKYVWVNDKCDLIASFVENVSLNDRTVSTICMMADSGYPSEWLIKKLNLIFESNPMLKSNFLNKVSSLNITLPTYFS